MCRHQQHQHQHQHQHKSTDSIPIALQTASATTTAKSSSALPPTQPQTQTKKSSMTATTSSSASSSCSSKRSRDFFKRSVAHRTVSFVEAEVDKLTASCRFLSQENSSTSLSSSSSVASLTRDQIVVGEMLGRGAFSEVYEVTSIHQDFEGSQSTFSSSSMDEEEHDDDFPNPSHHHRLDCQKTPLVIKHLRHDLRPKRSQFHEAAADLVLEAKFLAGIDHPNIIKLRGWAAGGISSFGNGSHDGYFILLDRLDETLSTRIREWHEHFGGLTRSTRPIPNFNLKMKFAMQIASALQYLHERDIIFRDLKPDNIGIKGDTIQLFDLGLCRELPGAFESSDKVFDISGVGTRRYMAPEVALAKPYNLKADVYGFSMVLYELFSHVKPFDLYNRDMHLSLVCLEGERPFLPGYFPKNLQSLLRRAWSQDATQRPTIEKVYKELEEIADGGPTGKKKSPSNGRDFFRKLRSRFGSRGGKGGGRGSAYPFFDLTSTSLSSSFSFVGNHSSTF